MFRVLGREKEVYAFLNRVSRGVTVAKSHSIFKVRIRIVAQ
jgi:hypothetical protein